MDAYAVTLKELREQVRQLEFVVGRLGFHGVPVDAYYASAMVEFLREKLLLQ